MTRNLTASLVDDLRARIVDGSFAPGEKLPSENTLIAEHGVSRTVVREAITRLQAEGLVHTRRGAGSFVLIPPAAEPAPAGARAARTPEERRHLLTFRAAVESEAAALAAGQHTGPQLALLDAALEAFAAAGTPAAAMTCDFDFHRAIAEASGNPYIIDAITGFGPAMIAMPPHRLEGAGGSASADGSRLSRVAAEHQSIRDAIAARDAVAAAAAMRTHLANSRRRLDAESDAGSGQA